MKNNILILYLPSHQQIVFPFPPLGIAVLAGYLRRRGIDVCIRDLETEYWNKYKNKKSPFKNVPEAYFFRQYIHHKKLFNDLKRVDDYLDNNLCHNRIANVLNDWEECIHSNIGSYAFVGFSILSLGQLSASLCFAKYLKQKYGVKIVFGGFYITDKMHTLLEKYKFIDYLIISEGEIPLLRLLSCEQPENIENLIFSKDGDSKINRIVSQYAQDMYPDFDGLPFHLYRQNKDCVMPYETSKGCTKKCLFCTTRKKELYIKNPDTVIEEISNIGEKYDMRYFCFTDNAINLSKKFCIEFCKKIIQNKLNIHWIAFFMPGDEDEAFFRLLKEAGCVGLKWGIDSITGQTLAKMNKRFSIPEQDVFEGIKKAGDIGISNQLMFILGYPGEKWSDLIKMMSFIKKCRNFIGSININLFDMERIDLTEDSEKFYNDSYINGKVFQRNIFSMSIREFKDRYVRFKYLLLKFYCFLFKIKFVSYYSRDKIKT